MSQDLGGCSGELKTIVAQGPFHAGMPALVGSQFGVTKFGPDIYSTGDGTGQKVTLRLVGVMMCDVKAETATDGQALYFDGGTNKLTTDDTAGPFVACAWGGYASPASGQALVRLNEAGVDGEELETSGTVTFGASDTTKTVSVGSGYNSKPVIAVLTTIDSGAATKVVGAVASGTLTLTVDHAPGTSKTAPVAYSIRG